MDVIKTQVAVKVEAVEGTAEALTATECLLVSNPKFDPDVKMYKRPNVTGSLSKVPNIPGARMAKMSFDVEMFGAAAAGTAPEWSAAMRACRVLEIIVALTSVTYTPGAADGPSVTLGMHLDGKLYLMWGARGNVIPKAGQVGEPVVFSFEFTGADWSEADAALLVPTYSTILPPTFQGATITLDGYAGTFGSMELDAGNQVALRPSASASSGYASARVTDRNPTLKVDPENVLVATKNFMGTWRSGATAAFSCAMTSGAAGNKFTITAPKVQYQKIALGEREGMSIYNIESELKGNAGNDEWSIAIT